MSRIEKPERRLDENRFQDKQAARKFVGYWTFRRGSEKEIDISIKAGRIVGDLYKELLKRYGDNGRVEHVDHVESCLAALGL